MYSNENKKDGQIRMKFEKVQFIYIYTFLKYHCDYRKLEKAFEEYKEKQG